MPLRPNSLSAVCLAVLAMGVAPAAPDVPTAAGKAVCGSARSPLEAEFLHRQRLLSERAELRVPGLAPLAAAAPAVARPVDDIAVLEATQEIVSPANPFDLSGRRITITPRGGTFSVASSMAAGSGPINSGGVLLDLDDDDFTLIELPFDFPFFGEDHSRLFVQSDGNITFIAPEASSTARSFSRLAGGPPTVAPFFRDLDPSKGGRVLMDLQGDRVVVTWERVPVYTDVGVGVTQTFQAALDADGVVEFRYGAVAASDAVVGVFPGEAARDFEAVDWSGARSASYSGSSILAEVFRDEASIDEYSVIQTFFRHFDDAYDTLILFNDLDFDASQYSLAHAYTVRNDILGIGEFIYDYGPFFGSPRRLSAFVNMGSLEGYPPSPLAPVPGLPHSSTLTILAHEVGHRYLAYATYMDPESEEIKYDLLGRQFAHWSFFFNSQASVLEGNAIVDDGQGASPRFRTVAATQTFSPLDQYLMGFLEPSEVPPTFLVTSPSSSGRLGAAGRSPEVGVTFDGIRKEIRIEDIIGSTGERRPSASMSQRTFRHAMVLVAEDAAAPDPQTIAALRRLRGMWQAFFRAQMEGRATVDVSLVRMLHLSTWPAGGVLEEATGPARITIAEPRSTDLLVDLTLHDPIAAVPSTVTIPAGQDHVEFTIQGREQGFTSLVAEAQEAGFDRAVTRLSVRDGVEGLELRRMQAEELYALTGSEVSFPLRFRVIDENRVPYAGVGIEYVATGRDPPAAGPATTDHNGEVSLTWQLASSPAEQLLTARVGGVQDEGLHTLAKTVPGLPAFDATGLSNAASGESACQQTALPDDLDPEFPLFGGNADTDASEVTCPGRGFSPGSLVTIHGTNLAAETLEADTLLMFGNPELPIVLAGTRVHVNGVAVPLVRVSPASVTFQVPFESEGLSMTMMVVTPYGRSEPVTAPLGTVQPAIFPNRVSGGARAAVVGSAPGSGRDVQAGGLLELYCTGLGPVSPEGRTGKPGTSQPVQRVEGEVEAWVDDVAADVSFSILATFEAGVYVVALELPDDLAAGEHTVRIAVDGMESNVVRFVSQ